MTNINQPENRRTKTTRRDFVKVTGKSTMLAGLGAYAFQFYGTSVTDPDNEKGKKETGWLAERKSTIVWNGDLLIIGATLSGVALAVLAARMGKKVILVEDGPVLGTEVSAQWNGFIPGGWFADEFASICSPHGGFRDNWFDPFISTLAFDRYVKAAGVSSLVCVSPMRPLPGEDGLLKGLEIVGKSGRQLIIAPYIIDATISMDFTHHILGLQLPQPTMVTRRLYLHGPALNGTSKKIKVGETLGIIDNEVEILPAMWPDEWILVYRMLSVSGTPIIPESAETYHLAITLTEYLRKENPVFANTLLVDVAPKCQYDFSVKNSISFRALKDTGLIPVVRGLNVVSDRKSAEEFLKRIFKQSKRSRLNINKLLRESGKEPVITHELSAASEHNFPSVVLPEEPAFWHEPSDIVVAGCGTAGSFAAIAAAKQGIGVTVLDPIGFPAGTGIRSKVQGYYHGIEAGMQKSIDKKISAATTFTGPASGNHPIARAETLFLEMKEANVKFGVTGRVFGVIKNGKAVTAVIIAGQDGYHVYPCRVAIDSTGDGDLAVAAGARYSLGRESDGFPFFFGYLPSTVIRNDSGWIVRGANNMVGMADATDTVDYSRGYFDGRAVLWNQGPFNAEKHYCSLATLLGMRQSRTIHGPLLLSAKDFSEGKSWPDKVCSMSSNFDRAGFFALESEWMQRWIILFGLWPQLWTGEVPYRCLYPDGVEGVLLGCRAFSVEHDMQSLARMQRDMQQLGEICGLAAAIAVKSRKMPSEINVSELQVLLREREILPQKPPELIMDLPVKELFNKLGGEQNGIAMWRLSLNRNEDSSEWELFSGTESDQRKLFCGAVAAALCGKVPLALVKVLEKAVDERVEGPLLGERSSPLCIVASLALAHAGITGTTERISLLLAESSGYPFIRLMDIALLYHALGISGGQEAIKPIRIHLATLKTPKSTDDLQLQFAGVRVLQSLGCYDESYRLEAHRSSQNLLIKKAGIRLSKRTIQS